MYIDMLPKELWDTMFQELTEVRRHRKAMERKRKQEFIQAIYRLKDAQLDLADNLKELNEIIPQSLIDPDKN